MKLGILAMYILVPLYLIAAGMAGKMYSWRNIEIYIYIYSWLVGGMQSRGGWLVEMIDVLTASLEARGGIDKARWKEELLG